MEWIKRNFERFSELSIWMKILMVLIVLVSPILIIFLIADRMAGNKDIGRAGASVTGGSDAAHDGVVDIALGETQVIDLVIEKRQDDAKVRRVAAEEKVMEEDHGKKSFSDNVDAAADAGSVDTVLLWRDIRRREDR